MMSPYISAALAALVAGYGGFLAGNWIGFARGVKDVPEAMPVVIEGGRVIGAGSAQRFDIAAPGGSGR